MMISTTSVFKAVVIAAVLVFHTYALNAAPLPDGTTLLIETGEIPDATGQCQTGSCFGMEVAPALWIWTSIAAGYDGGFVVGKDQSCGGQEIGPSGTNTTSGEVTAAWYFFGAYGTICANNTLNVFSDTSNDGTTIINDLGVAWNGSIIPLGGGSVNDYTITLDGSNHWSMSYSATIPSGQFTGVNFNMITRGGVVLVPVTSSPVVNNVELSADGVTNWLPDFTDPDVGDTHTCAITAIAANGYATVNHDCTGGTYTPGAGFEGADSFDYSVTDQTGLSATGTVTVLVVCPVYGPAACTPPPDCQQDYPVRQVTTVGGGQSPTVNATVTTTFTGHIMTEAGLTTGGKNAVRICSGTTVEFSTTTTVGTASCLINGASTAPTGTLAIGDKLVCTNKPDASDTDRFTIKNGE